MFPLLLTGEAKTWLDELNEGTIKTWDELRTAFISRFFPPTLFDRLLREIRAFSQYENESLTDAWLYLKEMLRKCHVLNAAAGGIFLYKTLNQAYQLLEDKVLFKLDWAKNQKTKPSPKKTVAFAAEGNNNSNNNSNTEGLNELTQEVLNAAVGGIFLYKTLNQAYQLLEDKVLLKLDWAKNQKTKPSPKKTVAFAAEGNNNSNTDKIMARMDVMTMKMDAQYKDFQSRLKQPNLDDDDIPISREEEAKFMQTFRRTRFYNNYRDRDSNRDNWCSSGRNDYNEDNYQSHSDDKPRSSKAT
ncbi:reverse transcriptase domain-containing protein [Tanacetum coccineum]